MSITLVEADSSSSSSSVEEVVMALFPEEVESAATCTMTSSCARRWTVWLFECFLDTTCSFIIFFLLLLLMLLDDVRTVMTANTTKEADKTKMRLSGWDT